MYEIRDLSLYPAGDEKIAWARSYMPLLAAIRTRFEKEQPFRGMKIAISIHLEAKTANLAHTLRAGGAEVWCTGCNPLSTQDVIAASLANAGFPVFAVHGASEEQYTAHIRKVLSCDPDLILDDGGDLLAMVMQDRSLGQHIIGGTEETTTGVMRMRRMEREGNLPFPMVAVNDGQCKFLFDNRYGTGQSVWDSFMRNTNLVVAGKTVVVAGYGWCSRGIAMRASGMGARVIVTEVDPVRALEAAMDGFTVMHMDEAAKLGDIFLTATGCKDVIVGRHFAVMKDGATLGNAGHFDVEVNRRDLEKMAKKQFTRRPNIEGYEMEDGRILNLICEGRLLNIAGADGHPVEIMDMSFALQALCLEYLAKKGRALQTAVYTVPQEIDEEVAFMKVEAMGMGVDRLTREQADYTGKRYRDAETD